MSWPSLSWRNAAYASALSSSPSGTLEHWLHMVTGSHISSHLHCQSSETQPRLSYFHRLLWENLTTDTGSQLGISSPSLTTLGTFSHFLLTVLKQFHPRSSCSGGYSPFSEDSHSAAGSHTILGPQRVTVRKQTLSPFCLWGSKSLFLKSPPAPLSARMSTPRKDIAEISQRSQALSDPDVVLSNFLSWHIF